MPRKLRLFLVLLVLALVGEFGVFVAAALVERRPPPDPYAWRRYTSSAEENLKVAVVVAIAGLALVGSVAWIYRRQRRDEVRLHLLRVLAAAAARGLPLGHALASVADDLDGPSERAVRRVHLELAAGSGLADALAFGARRAFPARQIEAIRSAEGQGDLAGTLRAAARETTAGSRLRSRFAAALAYPLILFAVMQFLNSAILPQFWSMVAQTASASMNPHVRAMQAGQVAGETATWGFFVGLALLLAVVLVRWDPDAREGPVGAISRLGLRLPGFRGVGELGAGERFCRALAPLVAAGIPFGPALRRAGAASGNPAVREEAEAAAGASEGGSPPGDLFGRMRLPRFVRVRAAAATSGAPARFGAALEALAAECGERRKARVDALLGWVYPVGIVAAAVPLFLLFRGIFAFCAVMREAALLPW